jgi:hypothetical protein
VPVPEIRVEDIPMSIDHTNDIAFLQQMALFKFFIDLLMKFDTDQKIRYVLQENQNRSGEVRQIYGRTGIRNCFFISYPNIPPISIHLCCANNRHTTCYKAFPTKDLYLSNCLVRGLKGAPK